MSTTNTMPWIDMLPNVAATDILARRDEIATMMDDAAALTRKAEALRAKAYFQGCTLEGDAKGMWSAEEIAQAKHRVGW